MASSRGGGGPIIIKPPGGGRVAAKAIKTKAKPAPKASKKAK